MLEPSFGSIIDNKFRLLVSKYIEKENLTNKSISIIFLTTNNVKIDGYVSKEQLQEVIDLLKYLEVNYEI